VVFLRHAILMDQHPLWLEAVAAMLDGSNVKVTATTSSAANALELVAQHQPDLVVTDLNGDPPADYIRTMRTTSPATRVIVLSAIEDPAMVEQVLAAGAVAYVVKTAQSDDLAAAVRQTFSRSVYFATPVGAATPELVDVEGESRPPSPQITRRELEILRLVAEGAANAAIAKTLWITEQTVKFHLSNVYRKLGVSNRTEAALWAREEGVFANDTDDHALSS
jgi:two-component system, NarL family, response regulator LiaR